MWCPPFNIIIIFTNFYYFTKISLFFTLVYYKNTIRLFDWDIVCGIVTEFCYFKTKSKYSTDLRT